MCMSPGAFQGGLQLAVKRRAHRLVIVDNVLALGPLARLVVGKFAIDWIDAEGKELIQAGRKRFQPGQLTCEEIPVESLEMA